LSKNWERARDGSGSLLNWLNVVNGKRPRARPTKNECEGLSYFPLHQKVNWVYELIISLFKTAMSCHRFPSGRRIIDNVNVKPVVNFWMGLIAQCPFFRWTTNLRSLWLGGWLPSWFKFRMLLSTFQTQHKACIKIFEWIFKTPIINFFVVF